MYDGADAVVMTAPNWPLRRTLRPQGTSYDTILDGPDAGLIYARPWDVPALESCNPPYVQGRPAPALVEVPSPTLFDAPEADPA